ncbi:MAG TPA: hypothetical protein VF937_00285 [Chloroflexota bacterium]
MLMRRRAQLFGYWLAASVLFLLVAGCGRPQAAAPRVAPADVVFVIPSGTESALERGESAFAFPDEIEVPVGGSVVITNEDYAMHYFFDIPVAPGQTIRKPFGRAGSFVYQGGLSCSISRTNAITVRVN